MEGSKMRQLLGLTLTGVVMIGSGSARAGMLEVQSNPVANGAITVAPGDNDRSDWAGIPTYPVDPTGDAGDIDFAAIQIAHDDDNFYLPLPVSAPGEPTCTTGGSTTCSWIPTWIGLPGSPAPATSCRSGSTTWSRAPAITASAARTQDAWAWNWGGGLFYDDFPTNDIELKIPRAAIGNPDTFDLIQNAATSPIEDYYPDGGNAGRRRRLLPLHDRPGTGRAWRYSAWVWPWRRVAGKTDLTFGPEAVTPPRRVTIEESFGPPRPRAVGIASPVGPTGPDNVMKPTAYRTLPCQ